jgi:two-component system NtrC family response regulator
MATKTALVRQLRQEPSSPHSEEDLTLPSRVEQLEQHLVFEALRRSAENQSRAARLLGISERNLRYRLKKWGTK